MEATALDSWSMEEGVAVHSLDDARDHELVRRIGDGDEEAFRRAISVPKRGIGDTTIDTLAARARELGVSLSEVASRGDLHESLRPAGDLYASIFRDGHACFPHASPIDLNLSGEDHRTGFLRRLRAAALNEKKIEPLADCLWFHKAFERLSAAEHKKLRDLAKACGTIFVGREFGNRFGCEIMGNLVGAFQSVNCRIRCFLLRHIFSCCFAERG